MLRLAAITAAILVLAFGNSDVRAQFSTSYGGTGGFTPGLPTPSAPPSGCTMNGTLDLTNTCNDIYILTGIF